MRTLPAVDYEAEADVLFKRTSLFGSMAEAGRACAERLPSLYLAGAKSRAQHRRIVDDGTDLLIEGFQRSGNTYLVAWVEQANPGVRIASHVHSVAHIDRALRRQIPVAVVTRPPEDGVASALIRRQGDVSVKRLLWRYSRFYKRLGNYLDQVVVSPFEVTTSRPDLVASALCERFGLELNPSSDGGERAAHQRVEERGVAVHGGVDEMRRSLPSVERERLATEVRRRLRASYSRELAELDELHRRTVASPSAVRP